MSAACDVLVVDDERVVADAIRLVLGDAGLTVETVPDAEAALGHPALARCRLVICDMMLPGQSGLDAVRAMHERRPGLPIVVITGYATPAHEEQALGSGAAAFLPKPFDDSELLDLVRRVLDRTEGAGEARRT